MKKLLSCLLIVILVFSFAVPAFAVTSDEDDNTSEYTVETEAVTEAAIDALTNELVQLRMERWTNSQSNDASNNLYHNYATDFNREKEILSEIESYGARKVGYEYVHKLNSNLPSGPSPLFFDDWNETNDDFYATGPYSRTVSGTTYYYVFLRVVPRDDNSILSDASIKTIAVNASRTPLADFVRDTISIYAQKTLGQVPVASWLPYEYLFADWSNKDINDSKATYVINVNTATTAKYVYVTDHDPNDEFSYNLALLDHSVSVAESHVSSWTKNGLAGQSFYPKNGNFYRRTVTGDFYDSPATQAIANYRNNKWYEFGKSPTIKFYKDDGDNGKTFIGSIPTKNGIYNPDFW